MSMSFTDPLSQQRPEDRWASISQRPEDQWFERKSGRIAGRDLAKALIALANAEGGTIVVGIHDGQYDGAQLTMGRENEIRQVGIDHTAPPVRNYVERIDVGEERTVLVITVPPSEGVHETKAGEVYLRVGDESKRLTFQQRKELEYDRGAAHFEAEPARDLNVNDLDEDAIATYRDAIGATADNTTALRARSLLTRDGHLTNGAVLLLGHAPQEPFPQAFVRVMRYAEDTPGTGSRQTLEAGHDARFEGPISNIIDAAAECIERWIPQRRALGKHGRFSDVPVIPPDAWLEGLVNAVVHRSYSMAGDHIRISIFPRRMEIESPGRFPGLANPTKPLEIARYARNPRIARVCADMGITLERGEGIRRMFDEMRAVGLTDPVYEQTSGSVRLILTASPRLDPAVQNALPSGADDVLEIFRRLGRPLGTGEVVEMTGRSRPWVREVLTALRDASLLSWTGKSARDPRAQWALVQEDAPN